MCDPPLLVSAVLSSLRRLVSTFSLNADNVLLRPREWVLATVVLLALISRVDPKVSFGMETLVARKHLGMMLLSYDADLDGLKESLRCMLEEDPNLLRNMITKKMSV